APQEECETFAHCSNPIELCRACSCVTCSPFGLGAHPRAGTIFASNGLLGAGTTDAISILDPDDLGVVIATLTTGWGGVGAVQPPVGGPVPVPGGGSNDVPRY